MAVTYAWRLDANKYAYLIDPTATGSTEYGYVSTAPLNGTQLATVAQTCNNLFGEDGSLGFSGYKTAFNAMIEKINDEWETSGAGFYDLLSADVYYNVDASYCADLRGVGIQGIRYLGASAQYDPDNPSWNPSIQQTDTLNLAGKFSLYGIYMDDQDTENTTNLSPERIFAVYNGRNGADMNGNFGTDVLQQMIEGEITRSTTADTEHGLAISSLSQKVDELEDDVTDLSSLSGSDLSGLIDRIEDLEDEKIRLEGLIIELQAALDAIKNPSSGEGGVDDPSSGANITIENYDNNIGPVSLIGIGENDTLYRIERATYDTGDVTIAGKIMASSFYQKK